MKEPTTVIAARVPVWLANYLRKYRNKKGLDQSAAINKILKGYFGFK